MNKITIMVIVQMTLLLWKMLELLFFCMCGFIVFIGLMFTLEYVISTNIHIGIIAAIIASLIMTIMSTIADRILS